MSFSPFKGTLSTTIFIETKCYFWMLLVIDETIQYCVFCVWGVSDEGELEVPPGLRWEPLFYGIAMCNISVCLSALHPSIISCLKMYHGCLTVKTNWPVTKDLATKHTTLSLYYHFTQAMISLSYSFICCL